MAIWQDLRYGLRLVRRNPGFAAVAVLTLGLGIGANCAMFSVINVILLRPLPYKNAGRIVALWQNNSKRALGRQLVSVPDYFDWKEQSTAFDGMAAWNFQYFNLTGADEPERVEGFKVTADYFPILGVDAALGRTFLPEEEQSGRDRVVILSDGLWRRRFGSDPTIVGRSVTIEGEPYTVVGVLPRDFRLFRVLNRELDLFVPHALDRLRADRSDHILFVYAKLRPGLSLSQAQAAMGVISNGIAQHHPDTSAGWGAEVVELHRQWTDSIREGLLLLQAAVGFVLLIACANIANLLLARSAGRQREMAVRTALGAGRFRLARQLLAESLVLGALGGAAGTILAILFTALLNQLPYSTLNRPEAFRVDAKVLAFGLGMALLSGVAAGLAPALQGSAGNLKPDGLRPSRVRSLLIVSEVALAVMLLAAAGLLIRSSLLVAGMNRGLNPRNVLTAQIWLPRARYTSGSQVARFWRQAVEKAGALPEVESASAVSFPPLSVLSTDVGIRVEGRPAPTPGEEPRVLYWVIGPRYFETVGISLQGRQFTEQDNDEAHGVVIVSAAMAQRFWPGESPLGKRIQPVFPDANYYWLPKSKNRWLTVVGVAGDVRLDGILRSQPQMYLPYAQNPSSIMHLVMRTAGPPLRLAGAVRQEIYSLDKDQPVFDVKSLEDVLAESITRPSFLTRLLAVFAGMALLLAGLGIYGVVAHFVSQRTREIGIRIALGAEPGQVVRFVMGQGLGAVLVGAMVGMAGALAGSRVLRSVLVGVSTTDLATFVGVPAVLILVAAAACYVPAERAAKMEPMAALRTE